MKKDGTSIDQLIERSSLGTARARALRRHTPRELVLRTLQRSDALAADHSEGKPEQEDTGVKRKPVAPTRRG
jgi:hypothetical protein